VLALLVIGVAAAFRNTGAMLAAFSVLVPILLAIAVSLFVVPIYVVRYVSFALGAFWVIVVYGLTLLPNDYMRATVAALMFAGVIVNLPALYGDVFYSRSDLRGTAAFIRAHWQSRDVIVHLGEFSAVTFDYYNRGGFPQGLLGSADPAELCQTTSGYERVWLVRDFGLTDPAEAATAERESLESVAGWSVVERHEFLGVHLWLAQAPGRPC
jgi:hypothetical protein